MSEVKRYKGNLYYQGFGPVKTTADVVMASDFDATQSELAALREELVKYKGGCVDLSSQVRELEHKMDYWEGSNKALQQRLTAAEQRNAAIVGKIDKCKECGSDDLFWFAQNTVPNGIQQNRLNTHDVKCVFVLGCNNCSETLKLVSADKIAEQMTAALKPTESGASE